MDGTTIGTGDVFWLMSIEADPPADIGSGVFTWILAGGGIWLLGGLLAYAALA